MTQYVWIVTRDDYDDQSVMGLAVTVEGARAIVQDWYQGRGAEVTLEEVGPDEARIKAVLPGVVRSEFYDATRYSLEDLK